MKLRIDVQVDAAVVPKSSSSSSTSPERPRRKAAPAALPPTTDVPYKKVDDTNPNNHPIKLDLSLFKEIPGQMSRYFHRPRAGVRTGHPMMPRPILH